MFPQPPPNVPIPSAGPPMSPLPYLGPVGYPPPAVNRRGRRAFWVLLATAVVLTIAVFIAASVGLTRISHLRHEVSTRQAQRDAQIQQAQASAARQRQDFTNAGLEAKLEHVKDLDKAVDTALSQWHTATIRYGVLNQAIRDCDDAVDSYDQAAAPFPDNLFGELPKSINLNNPQTDCGRAATGSI